MKEPKLYSKLANDFSSGLITEFGDLNDGVTKGLVQRLQVMFPDMAFKILIEALILERGNTTKACDRIVDMEHMNGRFISISEVHEIRSGKFRQWIRKLLRRYNDAPPSILLPITPGQPMTKKRKLNEESEVAGTTERQDTIKREEIIERHDLSKTIVAREDPKTLDIEDLAAFLDTHKKMRKDNENLRAEKEENAHLQEDLTKILRKVKRARRKLHAEEEQRLIAVNEAQEWQERADAAEAQTSELENEDRKKNEERDLLKKEKEDWRKAAMKWSTQNATLRTEKLALEDEKKDLETECNAAGGKISSQQTQSRTLQDQVQHASGSLLQQQITSLEKEKEGLMKQVEDLEQAVKDGIYNFDVYKKRVRILGNEFWAMLLGVKKRRKRAKDAGMFQYWR